VEPIAKSRLPIKLRSRKIWALARTILIVEDEFFIRMLIADFLRDEGFEVIEAEDADEALSILRTGGAIDLLFSDIRMPGSIDGRALAAKVTLEWPQTRIILTSGYSTASHTTSDGSGYPFMPKPYRPQAVLRTIRGMIG
jgi:DNA-binding NtrC family response regulator